MAEPTYEQLVELVASQAGLIERLTARGEILTAEVETLRARVAELEHRLGKDSRNSSKPPSSDPPWAKKPARPRSSRTRSGRRPGKQPGDPGVSRSPSDSPDETRYVEPQRCTGCRCGLDTAPVTSYARRQVVDVPAPAPPKVTEYRLVTRTCPRCGTANTGGWEDSGDDNASVLAGTGSPVRIGPRTLALCVLLTSGHYLPVGRSTTLLDTLTGMRVATGFTSRAQRRAADRLAEEFLPHLRALLASAPVLHADETTGRAGQTLAYVHVACTEYLTLMHVGGRGSADIDAGGVLPGFTGVLVRDGYAGYDHLPAIHAWCGAHLLRDLRSVSDADPDGQLWATAMADTLTAAHHAAQTARDNNQTRLDEQTLATLLNHYLGALAKGSLDNQHRTTELADKARTLIRRFRRYQDMILRFATDLTVPFTNNESERAVRPIKVKQRNTGGTWRTLTGLADFALVHSYLDTAHKWGKDKLEVLQQLFTTGTPWLPPALTPGE